MRIEKGFDRLKCYCEQNQFKGWDPFDGLNSWIIQKTWLKKSYFFKLAWIQFFKRLPINLRVLAGVPKQHNAKGLGLFLTAYCNLYTLNQKKEYYDYIVYLADQLLLMQAKGYSGSCWGYNFDWQARAFFQPKNTPTVVATSFISSALIQASKITNNELYLNAAISSASFILKDLNRSMEKDGTFAFSYSPLDKTQVYNASLLGCKLLCEVYQITKDESLLNVAKLGVKYVADRQNADGSWEYGTLPFHQWVDNFHTGYNLECIQTYQDISGDNQFNECIEKGNKYYVDNFFTEKGESKYYNNKLYPIDIHAPAQLVVTQVKLKTFENQKHLIDKVLDWTIVNMQNKKGYFYYQKRKYISPKIPYMRWGQAWMFYAMSYYLLATDYGKRED